MRIGIITFYWAENMGANLQCYALKKFLENMGHTVFVIQHRGAKTERIVEESNIRKKAFADFAISNFNLTKEVFSGAFREPLADLKLDVILCGSDQIWSKAIINFNPTFFGGDFNGDENIVLASYAASLGASDVSDDAQKMNFQYLLRNFDYVAVREHNQTDLLAEAINMPVEVVIDPTLLLSSDDYKDIIAPRLCDGQYVYNHYYWHKKLPDLKKFTQQLLDTTKLPLVVNHSTPHFVFAETVVDGTGRWAVEESLSALYNAEYITTSSFHCVAFSIIFKKRFWYILKGDATDNRIIDLLADLGLQDRIIDGEQPLPDNFQEHPDWVAVYAKLWEMRKKSIDYLYKVTSNGKKKDRIADYLTGKKLTEILFPRYYEKPNNHKMKNAAISVSSNADTTSALCSAFNAIHSAGYSLAQFIQERGYKKVIIYVEQDSWSFAEQAILTVYRNPNVPLVAYCSTVPFSKTFWYSNVNGSFATRKVSDMAVVKDCTVISLSLLSSSQLKELFPNCNVLDIHSVIAECRNIVYFEKPIRQYRQSRPNVRVITAGNPNFPAKNLSPLESEIVTKGMNRQKFITALKQGEIAVTGAYSAEYTAKDILEMQVDPPSYIDENGVRRYEDITGKFVNTRNGHRITSNQPDGAKNTIWLVGGCVAFGVGSPDEHTIASYLQQLVGNAYRVENYATFAVGRREDTFNILNALPVSDGDIVLFLLPGVSNTDIDMRGLFVRPHDYGEVFFCDKVHLSANGNKIVAQKFYERIVNADVQKLESSPVLRPHMYGIPDCAVFSDVRADNSDLEEYKTTLRNVRKEKCGRIGCIVMNCNPFTFGHRYLIETALKQCLYLYVFVVEEDKSVFPFEDRIKLVKHGTADLPNVMVLPSGKFIISSLTFNDYFNKSEIQDRDIDPSQDIEIFAQHIAPTLGITIRFAGEEPLDKITLQYNQTMARVLPQYGIEFYVVPRKESGGKVISASRVREFLKENNLKPIKKLVPKTTYKYLVQLHQNRRKT